MQKIDMISDANARTVSRRPWLLLSGFVVSLLVVWTLVGCFMGGEDQLDQTVPYLVVLGGGIAGERDLLACQLFAQGHGRLGVVLTGGNVEGYVPDRAAFLRRCGIPGILLKNWSAPANTYEELSAVGQFLATRPGMHAIVVSDALHMPRLRYLRDKLALNGLVLLRQSHLGGRLEPDYLFRVVEFWFREPLAYVYYRLQY
jgi:uncharacterized SAM-binding protein YcdF (DUF218 family)